MKMFTDIFPLKSKGFQLSRFANHKTHHHYMYLATPTEPIDREQIETNVLRLLGLAIIDLEDYCDSHIPDNYPRFQVKRGEQLVGTISTWGNKYCTQMRKSMGGYSTLYEAATCWCNPNHLKALEQMTVKVLEKEQSLMPDYF